MPQAHNDNMRGLMSTLAYAQSRLEQVRAAIADSRNHAAAVGLQECSHMIAAFYEQNGMAHGFSLPETERAHSDGGARVLRLHAEQLARLSRLALAEYEAHTPHDPRQLRDHLIEEELSELLIALANGDEVGALDALADLLYVIIGTATAFDLPVWDAFVEVHRSNMTKWRAKGDPALRKTKGDSYVPPDIAGVLRRYREQQKADAT